VWRKGNIGLSAQPLETQLGGDVTGRLPSVMGDFVYEKVDEYPGEHIIAVSHESPIWTFRHLLETGRAEHNMMMRHTGLGFHHYHHFRQCTTKVACFH
jgi:hypothetical protein